jgi:hypothetical protein
MLASTTYFLIIYIREIWPNKKGEYSVAGYVHSPSYVHAPLKDIPSAIVNVLKNDGILMKYPSYGVRAKERPIG